MCTRVLNVMPSYLSVIPLLLSVIGAAHARLAVNVQRSPPDAACRLRGGATEHTYAMLKPDVSSNRRAEAQIKKLIDEAGLKIVREERCRLSKVECEAFYAEHKERPFFPSLVPKPAPKALGQQRDGG